jgi:hypothetical protein
VRLQRGLPCLGFVVVHLAWLAGASAEPAPAPPPTTARLQVEAPEGCATRAELAARVALRSSRIRFADGPGPGLLLRARVAREGAGPVAAELAVGEGPGRSGPPRRLTAQSCADAVDALALMITILLDPTAGLDARADGGLASDGGGSRAAAAPTPPESPPARPVAAREPPAPEPPPASQPPPQVEARAPPAPAAGPAPPAVRRLGAGVSARAVSGPAPGLMPGVELHVGLAIDRASIWSPAVRLSAAHHWLSGWVTPGGTADFALDALGLDLCPARLRLGAVSVHGCATGAVGRLTASGSNTFAPESHARPWRSAGGTALLHLSLGAHVELEGHAGASAALVRDTFAFSEAFYRASAVTLTVGLGIALVL